MENLNCCQNSANRNVFVMVTCTQFDWFVAAVGLRGYYFERSFLMHVTCRASFLFRMKHDFHVWITSLTVSIEWI